MEYNLRRMSGEYVRIRTESRVNDKELLEMAYNALPKEDRPEKSSRMRLLRGDEGEYYLCVRDTEYELILDRGESVCELNGGRIFDKLILTVMEENEVVHTTGFYSYRVAGERILYRAQDVRMHYSDYFQEEDMLSIPENAVTTSLYHLLSYPGGEGIQEELYDKLEREWEIYNEGVMV